MEQKLIKDVVSELISIDDLIKSQHRYNIPRYQRLYVWENEQIDTLLNDLYEAHKTQKELFYLGGILIVKHQNSDTTFDMIDGQQRFTTLWLLALELKGTLQSFTIVGEELRLKFSIREEVTNYFVNALKISDETDNTPINTDNESLLKIDKARERIKKFMQELYLLPDEKEHFAAFIRIKVKLIVSEVPKDADLNKLFEVINNRGEQLQHHDILKSLILSHIQNKKERIRLGKIWNACSEMEDYIERTIQIEADNNLSEAYCLSEQTFDLKKVLEIMTTKQFEVNKPMTLNSILEKKHEDEYEQENDRNYKDEHPEAREDELQNIRSILTFPQLLLHTLRIYLFENGAKDIKRINEKELLSTFQNHFQVNTEKQAKAFISLLWEIRICFDLYIIKWVKQKEGDEVHLIKPLDKYNPKNKHTYYLRRRDSEDNNGFALLQSMLYHSQQITTHYWLTPLLHKAYTTRNKEALYSYLRILDNVLFCTRKEDTLPERTWNSMQQSLEEEKKNYSCAQLNNDLGVAMPHYWFYKTEFILWYLLKDKKEQRIIKDQQLWRNFRMTAKNSVEHISPQNPKHKENLVSRNLLNRFGNLALVSRSINSEFSNKPFRLKREHFLSNNTVKLDSLKLALVFYNDSWNDSQAIEHQDEMVSYFEEYFKDN